MMERQACWRLLSPEDSCLGLLVGGKYINIGKTLIRDDGGCGKDDTGHSCCLVFLKPVQKGIFSEYSVSR